MESTHTSMEDNAGFAILRNCDPENRWAGWNKQLTEGHLPKSQNQGCGINALVFLSEMTIPDGTTQVEKLVDENTGTGTPMEDIVSWLNTKNKTTKTNNNIYVLDTQPFVLANQSADTDNIKRNIYDLYKHIYDSLSINSCIIIKFNRDIKELKTNNIRLTPGHTIVLTKYLENNKTIFASIDPQQKQGPRTIKIDEWKKDGNKVSQGTYNALVLQNHYRSMSIIMVKQIKNNFNILKDLCIQLNGNTTNLQLDEIINAATLIKNNNVLTGGENVGNRNIDISELLNDYVLSHNPSSCSIIPEVKKTNNINGGDKLTNKKYKRTLKRKYKNTFKKRIKKR